ncbi:MAG: IS3 family transposase [Peptococcaceae bacterium]|jgi:hypothetical protein|nr:IS3 family transposase [Peptococcaceae bacterium]
MGLIDRYDPKINISAQCRLLELNRTSLYYKHCGPSEEDVRLKHRIDEIFTAWPFYGSRRITEVLRQEDFLVNRKAVRRTPQSTTAGSNGKWTVSGLSTLHAGDTISVTATLGGVTSQAVIATVQQPNSPDLELVSISGRNLPAAGLRYPGGGSDGDRRDSGSSPCRRGAAPSEDENGETVCVQVALQFTGANLFVAKALK